MTDNGMTHRVTCHSSVVKCIVAPVGLASHGGVINFSGVNIAPSDCVCATQHERCLSPLNECFLSVSHKSTLTFVHYKIKFITQNTQE